jgi:hypothetical protein
MGAPDGLYGGGDDPGSTRKVGESYENKTVTYISIPPQSQKRRRHRVAQSQWEVSKAFSEGSA